MTTNLQIDSYLRKNASTPIFLRTSAYDEVFDSRGYPNSIVDSLIKAHKPFGIVLNTDRSDQGGEHWFALYVLPSAKKVVLYDSLDYKWYPTPEPVELFIKGLQMQGYQLLKNNKQDQFVTIKSGAGRIVNDMCGAYAADALLMLQRANPLNEETLDKIHKKHRNTSLIERINHEIRVA
jgi:hypothetical protein